VKTENLSLKKLREESKVSLSEVALITKINIEVLKS
jgi:cytoskeletal protein RodZ